MLALFNPDNSLGGSPSLCKCWWDRFAAIFAACPASVDPLWIFPNQQTSKTASHEASLLSRVLMDYLGSIYHGATNLMSGVLNSPTSGQLYILHASPPLFQVKISPCSILCSARCYSVSTLKPHTASRLMQSRKLTDWDCFRAIRLPASRAMSWVLISPTQ